MKPGDDATPESRTAALAEFIGARGLAVPALFLVELIRPMSELAKNLLLVGGPLTSFLVPDRYLKGAAALLDDPRELESLARLLEARR